MKKYVSSKNILAVLIGALIILCIDYCYHKFVLTHTPIIKHSYYYSPVNKKGAVKIDDDQLASIKLEINLNEEKINSINKRIDDFYILSAIIVTLILAINIGVYFKTEQEVAKHFNDNYMSYREKIEGHLKESSEMVTKIASENGMLEELEKLRKSKDKS